MFSPAPHNKTVHVVAGPTAVGKTAFAISKALELGTEIISFDSRQCYREMTIGVARPSPEELATVPHHFIASHSLLAPLSAADYESWALAKAAELFDRYNDIVMVGGTGLYIKAFATGLDQMPPSSPALRAALHAEWQQKGLPWLQQEMQQSDPGFAETGDMMNPHRLLRALEVVRLSGRSIRSFQTGASANRPFQLRYTGLDMPREQLYARINQRVDNMMQAGLLDEVRQLRDPFGTPPAALQTVGYAELFAHLDGSLSLADAVDLIKKNTRHYAKRQLTWFRKVIAPGDWLDPTGNN